MNSNVRKGDQVLVVKTCLGCSYNNMIGTVTDDVDAIGNIGVEMEDGTFKTVNKWKLVLPRGTEVRVKSLGCTGTIEDGWTPKSPSYGVRLDTGKYILIDSLNEVEKASDCDAMDVKTAYKVLQAASGIAVGDKVKVLRKAKSHELGWQDSWADAMDEMIGNVYDVQNINGKGDIQLNDWYFPFYALEVVEKKPACIDIKIGEECYKVPRGKAHLIKCLVSQ